jgi:protein-S-isoprenylcysteine O-methyltransferase Ste14
MYDALMRLPLLGWVSIVAVAQLAGLIEYVDRSSPIDFVSAVHIGMRASAIIFLLLMATAVILRTRPSTKASGLEPRISALMGTFLMYSIVLFPRCELSLSLELLSTVLALVGSIGAAITIARLGRSFSLMAETRQLVTSGPYRFVRHPLYLTEEIAIIGVFMQFASMWTVPILVLHIAFQLRRMHNEETVLLASFPEYVAYRQHTARLIPGVY